MGKLTKRVLSMLIVAVMVISMVPAGVAATEFDPESNGGVAWCDACQQDVTWTSWGTAWEGTQWVSSSDHGHIYLEGDTTYEGDGALLEGVTCFHTNGYTLSPRDNSAEATCFNMRARLNLLGDGTIIGNGNSALHVNNANADVHIYGPTLKNWNGGRVILGWGAGGSVTLHDGVLEADTNVADLEGVSFTVNGGTISGTFIQTYGSPVVVNGGTINATFYSNPDMITVGAGYVKNVDGDRTTVTKDDSSGGGDSDHPIVDGVGYCDACQQEVTWTAWETTWAADPNEGFCKWASNDHYYLTGDTTYEMDGVLFGGDSCFHNNGYTLSPSDNNSGAAGLIIRANVNLMGSGTVIGNGGCALFVNNANGHAYIYGGTYKNWNGGKVINGWGAGGTVTMYDGVLEADTNVADLNNIALTISGGEIVGSYITMSNWNNSVVVNGGTFDAYFKGTDTYDKITVGEGYTKFEITDGTLVTKSDGSGDDTDRPIGADGVGYCEACKEEVTWTALTTSWSDTQWINGGHYYLTGDTTYVGDGMAFLGDTCFHNNGYTLSPSDNNSGSTAFVIRSNLNLMGDGTVIGNGGSALFLNNTFGRAYIYSGTYKNWKDGGLVIDGWGVGGEATLYGGLLTSTGSVANLNNVSLTVSGGKILGESIQTYGQPFSVTGGTVDAIIYDNFDKITVGEGYTKHQLTDPSNGAIVVNAEADHPIMENGYGYCEACETLVLWTAWETSWTANGDGYCQWAADGHYYLTGDTTYEMDGVLVGGDSCFHNNGYTLSPSDNNEGATAFVPRAKLNLMGNGTIIGNGGSALHVNHANADVHVYSGTLKNTNGGKVINGWGVGGAVTLHGGLLKADTNIGDLDGVSLTVNGGKISGTFIQTYGQPVVVNGGTIDAIFYSNPDLVTVGEGYVKYLMTDSSDNCYVTKVGDYSISENGLGYCEHCKAAAQWTAYDNAEHGTTDGLGGYRHLYLTEDVEYGEGSCGVLAWGTVCLHLNDHNLTGTAGSAVFQGTVNVMGNGIVTAPANEAVFHLNLDPAAAKPSVYGGTYKRTTGDTPIIRIWGNGGTVNFYGGTIDAADGGYEHAVEVVGSDGKPATFNMHGGKILTEKCSAVALQSDYASLNVTGGTVDGYISGTTANAVAGTGYTKYAVGDKAVIADVSVASFGDGWLVEGTTGEMQLNTKIGAYSNLKTLKVAVYDADGNLIVTTTPTEECINEQILPGSLTTITTLLAGISESWNSVWAAGHPNANSVPTTMELYVNGMSVPVALCGVNGFDNETALDATDWTSALNSSNAAIIIGSNGAFTGAYLTLAEAIAAAGEGDTIVLYKAVTENEYVQLSKSVSINLGAQEAFYVDLNGYKLNLAGNGDLYAIDTANDSYQLTDGAVVAADTIDVQMDLTADGKRYIALTETDGSISFHRLETGVGYVTLRTTEAGLYFKAKYNCDADLATAALAYGVVISLNNMPGADFAEELDTNLSTKYYTAEDPLISGQVVTSGSVFGIMKTEGRTPEQNAGYGKMKIYANPYLELADGRIIMCDTANVGKVATDPGFNGVAYSLYDAMKTLETKWDDATVATTGVKSAIKAFYNTWAPYGMNAWANDLPNIAG